MGFFGTIKNWFRTTDPMFDRSDDLRETVVSPPEGEDVQYFDTDKGGEPTLGSFMMSGQLWELFGAATKLGTKRNERYKEYEDMDTNVIVSSALELMVDDATQFDMDRGASIWPDEKSKYASDIKDFFKNHDIENRIWAMAYNTAKYGDFFLRVKGQEGEGLTFLSEDTHPSELFRLEIEGNLIGFFKGHPGAVGSGEESKAFQPWDFVHFINNYKPSFEKIELKFKTTEGEERDADKIKKIGKTTVKETDEVTKTVTSTYGTSVLDNARYAYKVLALLEDSLVLARLARAPQVRVFFINTEGMTPGERRELLKEIKQKFRSRKALNTKSDYYNSEYNPMSFNDDIFIPITGTKGDIRTEVLGGELNVKDMVDVDFQLNKLFAALRVPKAFLGFEESLPGSLGQSSLVRLDIRYARMVKKIQRAVLIGLTRLCQVHLSWKHKKHIKPEEILLHMTPISGAEEGDRLAEVERRMGIASQMIGLLRDLEGKVEDKEMIKYVFTQFLDLGGFKSEIFVNPSAETKRKAAAAAGGEFAGHEETAEMIMEGLKSGKLELDALKDILEKATEKKVRANMGRVSRDFGSNPFTESKDGKDAEKSKPNSQLKRVASVSTGGDSESDDKENPDE